MKKQDPQRQQRLQAKRTRKNQSRKGKTYNPLRYSSKEPKLDAKDTLIL